MLTNAKRFFTNSNYDTYYIVIGSSGYRRNESGDIGNTDLYHIGIRGNQTASEQYEIGISSPEFSNNFSKKRRGTNYIKLIRDKVFTLNNYKGSVLVNGVNIGKFVLDAKTEHEFCTSNTAAQSMYSLLGPHLKEDAKIFSSVNLEMFSDFYEFCNNVVDGAKEEYSLESDYQHTLDLTTQDRIKTVLQMNTAGWTDVEENCAIYPVCYTYNLDGTPSNNHPKMAIIATPILSDGTILTPSQLESDVNLIALGDDPEHDVYLTRFIGVDCVAISNGYKKALSILEKLYFNFDGTYDDSEERQYLLSLNNIAVNTVADGIEDDFLERLCILFDTDLSLVPYIIKVIEQMSTSTNTYRICKESDEMAHIQFNANGIVSSEVKLETLFLQLLMTGRAFYRRGENNKYEPIISRENPYPVTVLNQRNVYSKNNKRSFLEPVSGYQISFLDKEDNYTKNEIYVMDNGEDYQYPTRRIEPLNIPFITERKQLWSIGRYNLACVLYQKESYSRVVGMIGYTLALGDLVLLQDDSLLIGTDNSGRIAQLIQDDDYIYGFIVDDCFEYTGELDDNNLCKKGCTVVQPGKFQSSRCVTLRMATPEGIVKQDGTVLKPVVGITNVVVLQNPINKDTEISDDSTIDGDFYTYNPRENDLVAFGNIGSITSKAIIMSIQPQDKDKFELTLVPYNDKLFSAGVSIPELNSNMTTPRGDATVFSFREYSSTSENAESKANTLEVTTETINSLAPEDVTLTARAERDRIVLNVSILGGLANSIRGYKYQICRNYDSTITADENTWVNIEARDNYYYFDRDVDGYPEISNLIKYRFRAKAVNYNNIESENWSAPAELNLNSYLTWIPADFIHDSIVAKAEKDGINLTWRNVPYAEVYGTPVYTIYKDGVSVGTSYSNSFFYQFNRTAGEYPEKSDFSDSEWDFTISVSNESGKHIESGKADYDTTAYKTWTLTAPTVTATCYENYIKIRWTSTDNVYGNIVFSVSVNNVPVVSNLIDKEYFYYFDRSVDGYPEADDLEDYTITVTASNEKGSISGTAVSIDTSYYKTWIISKPELSAIAEEKGISVSWNLTNDSYGTKKYNLYKDNVLVAQNIYANSYYEEYGEDVYPLKATLSAIKFKVVAISDGCTTNSDEEYVNIDNYLGYELTKPELFINSNSRSINLKWNKQNVYSWIGADIQVSKAYKIINGVYTPIVDDSELVWYAPALMLNPYASEENYKIGNEGGMLEVKDQNVSFSVPLYGQSTQSPINTDYAYRIRVKDIAGNSAWSDAAYIQAKATSAYDVVKAWKLNDAGERVKIDGALGAQQIFVEELSALCANIGYLNDGGDEFNYWAIGDVPLGNGEILHKGSFRVGGRDKYIKVTPIIDEHGVPTGNYNLEFKVGDFDIDTVGDVTINGRDFTVYDRSGDLLFEISREMVI